MKNSKNRLTEKQRDRIVGMLWRGDRIQDIAYWFSVSPATVHALKKKFVKPHKETPYWGPDELPPPGPYQIVREVVLVELREKASEVDQARAERDAARALVLELSALASKYQAISDGNVTRSG